MFAPHALLGQVLGPCHLFCPISEVAVPSSAEPRRSGARLTTLYLVCSVTCPGFGLVSKRDGVRLAALVVSFHSLLLLLNHDLTLHPVLIQHIRHSPSGACGMTAIELEKELVMQYQKRRRYHSPDRRPILGVPLSLEWDGCSTCGDVHVIGKGQYCSIDGKRAIAFVMLDDDTSPLPDFMNDAAE